MSVTVVNMPKRRSDSDFTDYQVLTMVRANPGINIYQLSINCEKQMRGNWSRDKVRRSIERLIARGRVTMGNGTEGGRACRKVYSV